MPKKHNKCIVLILVLFLSVAANLYAVDMWAGYVSQKWTSASGLPGNTVTDIVQGKDGYMYIGTYDGLVRFDGCEFKIINHTTMEDFNFSSARAIFQDSNGVLWIGSNDEGVARIEGKKVTMYTIANGLPNNSVRSIVEDKQKNIWIGTADGVVYITPQGDIVTPAGLAAYGDDKCLVVSLYCDTAGRVWMATTKMHGVYYYTPNSKLFKAYTGFNAIDYSTVNAVAQDSDGSFWFGLTQRGVVHVSEGKVVHYESMSGFVDETINHIFCDSNGNMWFGTEKGVAFFKDNVFDFYTEEKGLTNNNVKKIFEDREKNIWLATDRGGIEKIRPGLFTTTKLNTTVNCIAIGKDGTVWLGADNGLYCIRNDNFIENALTELCHGVRVRHLAFAQNGDLLVSTYSAHGQLRMRPDGRIQEFNTKTGLSGDAVRVALDDANGNFYIGTTSGLNIIDAGTGGITHYDKQNKLTNDYVMCLYEAYDGKIWVGTDGGGICVFDNGKLHTILTTDEGLAGNVIFKISQDKEGNYWITTGTGFSCISGGNITNYTAASGLTTNSVFQILIDYTDTVWMTSNKGICSTSMKNLKDYADKENDSVTLHFYNRNDGLDTDGVPANSLCALDNLGRIWFPLVDGFAVYDPLKVQSNDVLPPVQIERIVVDNEEITDYADVIELSPNTKRIDIKYTGLSFVSSERVKFKYQLEGFEKDYSPETTVRTVSYTNLAPGKYVFSVMAANTDGLWNPVPVSVRFEKKPHLYERISFWVLVSVAFIMLVALIIYERFKRMKNEQLKLETMIQIKTIDLQVEKDKAEILLHNILPNAIAERLKVEKDVIADGFDNVSVLFTDLVGFTSITSNVSADELVLALNDLFSRFDERATESGIEKIKTIGDAYMAVCGLPEPNPDHAKLIMRYAQGMLADLADYNSTTKLKFKMRIGINSGKVVAGVIGRSKFIYDLWGDTVNVASRMESTGIAGKIHVSASTYELLKNEFAFSAPMVIDVKGKGAMKTYFFDDGTPLDPAVFSKPVVVPDRTSKVLYDDNSDTQGQFFGLRV